MKKNIIKLVSATIIAASVAVPTTSAIFGEYNPDKIINANEQSTKMISQKNSIIIDNKILEDSETINSEDSVLFPARKVFEALGYTVEWQDETRTIIVSNLPQYITFSIGTDGYTIAKTAPLKLNKAPELIDGVTYVPVSLLSEIMEMNAEIDEDYNLIINTISDETETQEETKELDKSEKTTENLDESEESTEIQEETETSSENSDKIEETTEETTEKISDKSEETTKETLEINLSEANAEVISIDDESVTVNDSEIGEVVLEIGDTKIVFDNGTEASKKDIKEGSKLSIKYGEAMTASIPPINNPEKIVIFK